MDKILNQEEIDALFHAVASGPSGAPRAAEKRRNVVRCNFRREAQINKDQVRSIGSLHEGFARNLGHSLGAYLRVVFDVNLVSVEQLPYADFLQRLPETTYTASISLQPLAAIGALQIDLALAFPTIDLLLGGQGKTQPHPREVTEIEDQILESVGNVVCRELQATWQPLLDLELRFDQRLARAAMQRLLPPDERILSLSFEVQMPGVRGTLNLVFSGGVSSALLKKLSQQWSHRKYRGPTLGDSAARERMLGCVFPVELRLDGVAVRGRELLELEPNRVLVLRQRIEEPARLLIAGERAFLAHPVRRGSLRAARILQPLELAGESAKGEA